ncbi:MAG: RNA polymerase sigma factor [Candidatus Zixiibacteriota bacterium]
MENDDENLILLCQKGKIRAFETLVNRYKKNAYFIALGLVGNSDDAFDLSQEAFVRVYKSINKYNGRSKFFPWFYTILTNLCKNHLKKQNVRKKYLSNEIAREKLTQTQESEGESEKESLKQKLLDEIDKLPYKFKEVIVLKHFRGFSYKEISETLGIPVGSVMSRLYYARKKLKENLKHLKG